MEMTWDAMHNVRCIRDGTNVPVTGSYVMGQCLIDNVHHFFVPLLTCFLSLSFGYLFIYFSLLFFFFGFCFFFIYFISFFFFLLFFFILFYYHYYYYFLIIDHHQFLFGLNFSKF